MGEGRDGSEYLSLRPVPPHALGSAPERVVSVLSELRSVRAREGDGATFECIVSEVETTGSWKLGGRPLRPGGRVRIRHEGLADFPLVLAPCRRVRGSHRPRPTTISPTPSPNGPSPLGQRAVSLSLRPSSLSPPSWPAPLPLRHPNSTHPVPSPALVLIHRVPIDRGDLLRPHPHPRSLPRGGSSLASALLVLREETYSDAE